MHSDLSAGLCSLMARSVLHLLYVRQIAIRETRRLYRKISRICHGHTVCVLLVVSYSTLF